MKNVAKAVTKFERGKTYMFSKSKYLGKNPTMREREYIRCSHAWPQELSGIYWTVGKNCEIESGSLKTWDTLSCTSGYTISTSWAIEVQI